MYLLAQGRMTLKNKKMKNTKRKGHALKACCTLAHFLLNGSGASNHMATSKESFSSFQSFDGPSIQMGNNIKVKKKGRDLSSLNIKFSKMCYFFPP